MESPEAFMVLLALMLAIAIGVRLIAGALDRQRIASYVEIRGGRVIEATWSPFGPGWFAGNRERIYHIRFRDHEGNIHQAYARTNMWSGVYFTEDHIVHRAHPQVDLHDVESLEEENARLRAELERLRRRERDKDSDAIKE
ncbi:MAG TPA: hypothetical protein VFE62_05410 [Gemmataceae bacterium]|nr:hypothetical protein [Gemmataceae bacterium]